MSDQQTFEKAVHRRAAHLKALVSGIIVGLMTGGGLFVATNWLVIKGGQDVGVHLSLLNQFYIGYSVSFVGSFIGFFYAFATGFVGAYLVARIYNWIVDLKIAHE